jgi:uncharacterized membrane protein YbhN (UPF0104 family)
MPEDWQRIAAAVVGAILAGPLAWLGLIVLRGQILPALVLAAGALCLLAVAALLLRRSRAVAQAQQPGRWGWLPARLRGAAQLIGPQLAGYLGSPSLLGAVFAISLAFQLLAGYGVWLNLSAVGAQLPLHVVVLATAIAGVAGLLPITINGWGVREGLFVALLTPFGATAGQALAGALLGRCLVLLVTLPGAALLVLGRRAAQAASPAEREWAPEQLTIGEKQ